MTTWTFARTNWTPVGVADANAFTDGGYMALQGGGSTQIMMVSEVYMGGLATVQSPMNMIFSRDSTVGVTLSGTLTNAPDNPNAIGLSSGPTAFSTSTTKPQRSATLHLLAVAFNAFGGISRWTALEPDARKAIIGNTASAGEASLSCDSSGSTVGAMSSHIIYEPI